MREARKEMMQPLYEKVDKAAMKLCVDNEYDYILNTDDCSYIAINPKNGIDITEALKQELKIE
jgi:Skp family chaperone for outer membrane proteins